MSGASTSHPAFNNTPPAVINGVQVIPNVTAFMDNTMENVKRLGTFVSQVTNPWSEDISYPMPKWGIAKKTTLVCKATFTVAVGTGAVTVRDHFPHNIVKRLKHQGNNTDIHTVRGCSLHTRVMRMYRNAPLTGAGESYGITAGSTPANGTYTVLFELDVPHCYDYASGIGAQYSAARGAAFEEIITLASKADLFAFTGTADVTGFTFQVQPVHFWWTLPSVQQNGVEVIYVPDMSRLFQMIDKRQTDIATGDQLVELSQTSGNVQVATFTFRNNNANVDIGGGGLDYVGWNFAGNETPRLWTPTEVLKRENALRYRGVLPYNATALDFEYENSRRDAVVPRNISNLGILLGIPSGTLLVNPEVLVTQEILIGAVNAPAVVTPAA